MRQGAFRSARFHRGFLPLEVGKNREGKVPCPAEVAEGMAGRIGGRGEGRNALARWRALCSALSLFDSSTPGGVCDVKNWRSRKELCLNLREARHRTRDPGVCRRRSGWR